MHRRALALSCLVAALASAGAACAQVQETPATDSGLLDRYVSASQDAAERALSLIGVRYRRGGNSPESGLDCSGLVRYVFQDTLGFELPRRSRDISRVGEPVDPAKLRPGDLVFFNTLRDAFSHVGVYLGDFRFLHAPSAGKPVRIDDMREHYWVKR
ncbi:MAG TPA: peptidase P60, partial [Rhodocyclaceae bacterium]|nr:peptidase P60 [Rhodocyclaceae bacterium]